MTIPVVQSTLKLLTPSHCLHDLFDPVKAYFLLFLPIFSLPRLKFPVILANNN